MTDTHYRDSLRVRGSEIDPRGRLSILAVANYMQEAAGLHAGELGFALDQLFPLGLTWVLARLRIRIDRYPRWRERVGIETWPSSVDARFTTRDFVFTDAAGERFGVATTSWAVMDLKTRSPRPPQPEFVALITDTTRVLTFEDRSLPRPEAPQWCREYDVRLSDLDLNRHVNNVVYLNWALEPVPLDVWKARTLREVDLSFKAEVRYGETVSVEAESRETADGLEVLHRVLRKVDGAELAVARSRWGAVGD